MKELFREKRALTPDSLILGIHIQEADSQSDGDESVKTQVSELYWQILRKELPITKAFSY